MAPAVYVLLCLPQALAGENARASRGRQVLRVSIDGKIEVEKCSDVRASQEESRRNLELEIFLPGNFWLRMKVHISHGM